MFNIMVQVSGLWHDLRVLQFWKFVYLLLNIFKIKIGIEKGIISAFNPDFLVMFLKSLFVHRQLFHGVEGGADVIAGNVFPTRQFMIKNGDFERVEGVG